MHREAQYLRPALRSLDASALQARASGITVELIAVFDRPDAGTLEVFRATPVPGFAQIKTAEVDFGSLGLARNAGIDLVDGEFVWTADGDDLVSRNSIVELLRVARGHPEPNVAVFMEFYVAFGDAFHVARYFDGEYLTAADFAYDHPYTSRVFLRRSAFDDFRYRNLRVTSGFAYEDWEFNCRLFATGFAFKVAPETILFYRQRSDSLLKHANATSARIVPHTPLFEPDCYCQKMDEARARVGDWSAFIRGRQTVCNRNFTQELVASEQRVGFIEEAAAFDPEVDPLCVEASGSYCPIPWEARHWGFKLETLYKLIGKGPFGNVLLFPWLKPGGGEKYILRAVHELHIARPDKRILVLTGESARRHEWSTKLPEGSAFVDVFNAFPALPESGRDSLIIRALLAVAEQDAFLHLKASPFTHRLMDRYGAALSQKFTTVYYRFSDRANLWRKRAIQDAWFVRFLRRQLANIDLVISDNNGIAESDELRLGSLSNKYHTLYAYCECSPPVLRERPFTHRLLWASRVSPEKKPELVPRIAAALRNLCPRVVIDVYGNSDRCYDPNILFRTGGLRYCGPFDGFDSLPTRAYDALLYTSAFDGLPNVILEALGRGLPVIAPDVGAIAEAVVDGETGFLVPGFGDDEALVQAYVGAVQQLYCDQERAARLGMGGRRLIAERHNEILFSRRVGEIFLAAGRSNGGAL
jgi:glycosyltransferase involved in cell wall biosynthesis